jgi:hypothetical protein
VFRKDLVRFCPNRLKDHVPENVTSENSVRRHAHARVRYGEGGAPDAWRPQELHSRLASVEPPVSGVVVIDVTLGDIAYH